MTRKSKGNLSWMVIRGIPIQAQSMTRRNNPTPKQAVDSLLKSYQPKGRYREDYWFLIDQIRSKSELLSPKRFTRRRFGFNNARKITRTISQLAEYKKEMVRPIYLWRPESDGWRLQFRSLMRHLFELYPVPDHLAYCWTYPNYGFWVRSLYFHMAKGYGLRQFQGGPAFHIDKKTARWYCEAPHHLPPLFAIRWAQARALGADFAAAIDIARAIGFSNGGSSEDVWEPVVRFFVRYQPIQFEETSDIAEFIYAQRFLPAENSWGRGGGPDPLQPDFSLKGRTLQSLRRYMISWRKELLRKRPELAQVSHNWPASDLRPLVHREGEQKYTIMELVSDRALAVEGLRMRNCVAEYASQCALGRSSIWSLRLQESGKVKRMATIEVNPQRKDIHQLSGICNSRLSPGTTNIVIRWARQEGLTLRGRKV
ncbi:hypothetical protein GC197_03695 [bacterium]|nr:hypothetical protein [bacterium]